MAEDDIFKIHAWAERARLDGRLLELALQGEVIVDVNAAGSVTFRQAGDADRARFRAGLAQFDRRDQR